MLACRKESNFIMEKAGSVDWHHYEEEKKESSNVSSRSYREFDSIEGLIFAQLPAENSSNHLFG